MKIYIYKLIVALFLFYIFFEFTIGLRIDYFKNKIDIISDHQARLELKEKLKDELKKGIEKENYFTETATILFIRMKDDGILKDNVNINIS